MLEELIKDRGMQIHVVQTQSVIDKNSHWQQMLMFDLGILMGKAYVASQTENVLKGQREKVRQGGWNHMAPMGYRNYRDPATDKATVVLDEHQAFLVKRLFQEYATGTVSLSELAEKARQWGLKSARAKNTLSKSSIATILKNPFYYGMMQVKGQLHPHVYPTLIDKSLFDACQRVFEQSNRKTPIGQRVEQRSKKPFIFRGLIRCAHCGCQVSSDIKKGRYIYLFCTKAKGKHLCQASRIREGKALAVVEDVLNRIRVSEPMIEQIKVRLKAEYDEGRAGFEAIAQQLQNRFSEIEQAQERLLDMAVHGRITQDAYDKKRHQFKAEQESIAQQLMDYTKDSGKFRDSFVMLLRTISDAAGTFKSSKVEEKRKVLNFVFSNLFLDGQEVRYELNRPFDKLLDLAVCQEWWRIGDSNP